MEWANPKQCLRVGRLLPISANRASAGFRAKQRASKNLCLDFKRTNTILDLRPFDSARMNAYQVCRAFGTLGFLSSEKKIGHKRHVESRAPMNVSGWSEPEVLQYDQAVGERHENCDSEEYCRCMAISSQQKRQNDDTRKDISDSLNPHVRKGVGVVIGDTVSDRSTNRIEYEIDTDRDDGERHQEGTPKKYRILS